MITLLFNQAIHQDKEFSEKMHSNLHLQIDFLENYFVWCNLLCFSAILSSISLYCISTGSEIAPSWLPMRPNIESWRPEFHNWSPAGN